MRIFASLALALCAALVAVPVLAFQEYRPPPHLIVATEQSLLPGTQAMTAAPALMISVKNLDLIAAADGPGGGTTNAAPAPLSTYASMFSATPSADGYMNWRMSQTYIS